MSAPLLALLALPPDEARTPREELRWCEALLVWLLEPDRVLPERSAARGVRLRLLGRTVDAHPRREALLERVAAVWRHSSAVRLLAEMGLPDQTSFFAEVVQRVTDRLLPTLDEGGDLYSLVDRLGLGEGDARWLEELPDEERARWTPLFAPPPEAFAAAAALLACRASALGLSRDLLLYQRGVIDLESPFFLLPAALRRWTDAPADAEARAAWQQTQAGCRASIRAIHQELERRGVSTDVVFRLDLLKATLTRIEVLLALATASAGEGEGLRLALALVRGSATQHSLRGLLGETLQRLARKVVEHSAETGEHYIANTRQAWRAMLASAFGGGLLTAGTAMLKSLLAALPLAPALLGAAHALNYSASFILMQLFGLSLASKQPAMTGAALADALEQENGLEAEIELVSSIARTQFIAAVGNVSGAVPMALLVDLLIRGISGAPLLSAEHAARGLADLHPFTSWSLPFAALTGVFLWLSSVAAGWAANWSAFRSLPQALAHSRRVRALLGLRGAHTLGSLTQRHLSGVAGYLVLGFLLGFVPPLAKFAGVGLEVRHVTLSAASAAFDASALWSDGALHPGPVLWAALGVALIGVLNFGVSFALALRVALQARGVERADRRSLRHGLWRALTTAPWRFLFPPPDKPTAAPTA